MADQLGLFRAATVRPREGRPAVLVDLPDGSTRTIKGPVATDPARASVVAVWYWPESTRTEVARFTPAGQYGVTPHPTDDLDEFRRRGVYQHAELVEVLPIQR